MLPSVPFHINCLIYLGWIWEWDEKLNLNKNPFVLIENYNYDIIDLTIWSRIELTKIFALTKSKNLLVFQDRIM